jgi:hypothetical protein
VTQPEQSPDSLAKLREIADAVLYEGYVLYPYRASAAKNRSRWQFGVLMPKAYAALDPNEPSSSRTECVLEVPDLRTDGMPTLRVLVRFLQVQRRSVERSDPATARFAPVEQLDVNGTPVLAWDEAVEHEVEFSVRGDGERAFRIEGGEEVEPVGASGRIVRRRAELDLGVTVGFEQLPIPWGAARMTLRIENRTAPGRASADREGALPYALVAAHCLVVAEGARFISMVDYPDWAAAEVKACVNLGTWPVLGGDPGLLLSTPIILYDNPELAPQSPGALYDSTEIDEILTLRTMTLSDDEKAQARATDPRAAAVIDRTDSLSAQALGSLHGTMRRIDDPYAELFGDADTASDERTLRIQGRRVGRGSKVLLRPGARRADAQDMFLAGRAAFVEAVLGDLDGRAYLAVVLSEDPGLDVKRDHGRFLYFDPDEVEPCDADAEGDRP